MWPFNQSFMPIWRSSLQFLKHVRFSELAPSALNFPSQRTIPPDLRNALPPLAKRMLDDGIVKLTDRDIAAEDNASILRSYLMKCNTPEERHEAVVSFCFLLNVQRLAETACEKCLYQKKRCICGEVDRVKPKHNLWVFQHHGEFGRSNNTGSILCLVAGAKRTIRGLRQQQDEMLDHVSRNRQSTVILFPTPESTTLDQYRAARSKALGSAIEREPLTLVLLDGTSRQAKNLDRFMPHIIPRIRIRQPRIKSWLDPIRRQTEEHRVCTAQAAAIILRELGDERTSVAIENAVRHVVRLASEERSCFPQEKSRFADLSLPLTMT